MKIVNFKKFLRSICIILIVIFIASLIWSKASLSHKETEYEVLHVADGDTLWSIANDLQKANSYYKGKDIRDIILNIKKLNKLESSNIYVNQELVIPVV